MGEAHGPIIEFAADGNIKRKGVACLGILDGDDTLNMTQNG